jgi:thioredoxin-dependent peroxiredoxin
MWRTMCTLLLLGTTAGVALAQNTGDVSPLDKTHDPPPALYVPEAIVRTQATDRRDRVELAIGVPAPDFTLGSSSGQPVRLADRDGRWTMLVFAQKRRTLVPLKDIDADLRKAGVGLYGVCGDAVPRLADFVEYEQLPFTLLSDRTRDVSTAYHRYDAEFDLIRPGVILIDPKGLVRMTLPGRSPQPDELLKRILHAVTTG